MITIAACDDNALFLTEVSKLIEDILAEESIACRLTKFTGGAQLLAAPPFDIVFLDIGLDGADGMEIARRLRERGDRCAIVFLTAHPRYVFSAFDVGAANYLLKPVDPKKLRSVLVGLARKTDAADGGWVAVRHGAGLCRIPLDEILYIEVLDRKVYIHTSRSVYDFYGKLDKLELEFPEGFFRCHRSFILNLSHVRRYDRTVVTLDNGETVPVAKRKYPEFCKEFLKYLAKGGALL